MLMLLWSKLGALAMAALPVGALSFVIFQFVKRGRKSVDEIRSPIVKQTIVAAIAFLLTAAFSAMGLSLDCVAGENCLALVTEDKIGEVVKWAAGAIVAFVIHAVKNGRK